MDVTMQAGGHVNVGVYVSMHEFVFHFGVCGNENFTGVYCIRSFKIIGEWLSLNIFITMGPQG